MQQTTLNRGHLAFLSDQLRAAEMAFIAGELADVEAILKSLPAYIDRFLTEANQGNAGRN